MNAREYLNILHTAEKLKDTPRHCTTSNGRTESVAEHSWRVSLMARLLKHEFPDVDMDKVTDMCLIHDLGECFTGDVPTFSKTDADRSLEDDLLEQWISSLPEEVSSDLKSLFAEMNAQETKEARIYKALDKLEALIQHNESPLYTWSENEFELNKHYAFDSVRFSEWLTELREEILKDTCEKTADAVYLSKHCDVFYVEDKNVVLVHWKKYCELDQYRTPLLYALEVIRSHPGCNYAADTRDGFEDNPLDTKWVAEFFMPKAKEYGCKIIYFIIDKDNQLKEELEGQEKDSSDLLEFRYIYGMDQIT